MPKVFVLCPTFRKFDLCAQMINSAQTGSLVPDGYIILDNSGGKFIEYVKENNIILPDTVTCINADYNVGCEPGWNLLMRVLISHVDANALAVIVNDDIVFNDTSIETIVNAALNDYIMWEAYNPIYCAGGIDAPNAFSFFLTHPQTLFNTVGPFSENYAPAYHSDNDMHWRMRLMGYDLVRVADCSASHGEGSATIKTYDVKEELEHHKRFERNENWYVMMWGGRPGNEQYRVPFNGEDIVRYAIEIVKRYGF